jgi:hypothetical protein
METGQRDELELVAHGAQLPGRSQCLLVQMRRQLNEGEQL